MSTPWSKGGPIPERDHWPEWKEAARNYLTFIVVFCVGLFIAGYRCARSLEPRADPAAIAADSAKAAAYGDSLARSRADRRRADSLAAVNVELRAQLDSAQRDADSVTAIAQAFVAGVHFDETPRVVARDPGSRSAADTVAYIVAQRAGDSTHYLLPKFIGDGYQATLTSAAAWEIVARREHALRLNAEARFVDDSTHRAAEQVYSDSAIAALEGEVSTLKAVARPRCRWKCGAVLGGLVVALVPEVPKAIATIVRAVVGKRR
jgi:hypothetical protein